MLKLTLTDTLTGVILIEADMSETDRVLESFNKATQDTGKLPSCLLVDALDSLIRWYQG